MVAAAHKTGKLQGYRIQQYSLCSNKISLNFSETALPPLLLLFLLFLIIIINNNNSNNTTDEDDDTIQSVSQSVPSYFESPGSIPDQSKRYLWWMKGHWDMVSLGT
jgi:hypothetical protein